MALPMKTAFKPPLVPKRALVSTSRDIYRNLALEHWLYKNHPFNSTATPTPTTGHILMLWVNDPCVVIGRHQNPWSECNVPWLAEQRVPMARRNSGGGAVYHDAGNVNLTFFTPHAHHHRRTNLEFIADTMRRHFDVRLELTTRDDLTLGDAKVSGTAAKLARFAAYHHCTLLAASDTRRMRNALQVMPDWRIVDCRATRSTRATRVRNLNVCVDALVDCMAHAYLKWNLPSAAPSNGASTYHPPKIEHVTPSEEHFPGIDIIRDEFASWQWLFGKTPKFTTATTLRHYASSCDFTLTLTVQDGRINVADVTTTSASDVQTLHHQAATLIGRPYDLQLIRHIDGIFVDGATQHQIAAVDSNTFS